MYISNICTNDLQKKKSSKHEHYRSSSPENFLQGTVFGNRQPFSSS